MLSPNEIIERWFEEVWNEGASGAIDDLLATHAEVLGFPGGPLRGPEEFRQFHDQFNRLFFDFDILINESVEWDDEAMVRFNLIMTHRSTHHRAALEAACWVRCRDSQIVECRNYIDFLALLNQLSLAPEDFFQQRASQKREVV